MVLCTTRGGGSKRVRSFSGGRRQRGSKRDEEKEGGRDGGGATPRRVEASSAHLPVRKDGGLGMRSYRGIPGFELVPPTKSIAPVRPPREELFLFSHSSYNRPNPPSHLSNVILLRRRHRPVIECLPWIR